MAHAQRRPRRRRTIVIALIGAAALSTGLAIDALASGNSSASAAQTIVCPSPAGAIGAVPAAAQNEVTRELANLDRQIAEANNRLATTVGQGGPNFVQNAILGPLASKRGAALDRIAIAIGRVAARPQGLDRFATCSLGQAGQPAPQPPQQTQPAPPPATGGNGGGSGAAQTIACPAPVLPAVPAAAQAEVTRELANLDRQIAEANNRLVTSAGQGGPNFVQNAILGPLASKRGAALDRIAIAIGRVTTRPQGLERFATCALR
jgi:hypothetical protein